MAVNDNSASSGNRPQVETPLYLDPLPALEIPRELIRADWDAVSRWVYNLTTDELQQYSLVALRGEDPRLDIPDDYRDRDEVVDKMLRIAVWNAGITSAGDQSEWLRERVNSDDGALTFSSRDGSGPDWGYKFESEGSLDASCAGITQVTKSYLWRINGSLANQVIAWNGGSVTETAYHHLRANGSVQLPNLPAPVTQCGQTANWSVCDAKVYFYSKTQDYQHAQQPDGRLKWLNRDLKDVGDPPPWARQGRNTVSTNQDCSDAVEGVWTPCNVQSSYGTPSIYWNRESGGGNSEGTIRAQDRYRISCVNSTLTAADSCWSIAFDSDKDVDGGETCAEFFARAHIHHCDSCFWTVYSDAVAWDDQFGYYTNTGNPDPNNTNCIYKRYQKFNDVGAYMDNANADTVGGWMYQQVFWSNTPQFSGNMLIHDSTGLTGYGLTGRGVVNSYMEEFYTRVFDPSTFTQYLGDYVWMAVTPVWRWDIVDQTLPQQTWFNVQLLTYSNFGNTLCNTGLLNNLYLFSTGSVNPSWCSTQNKFYGAAEIANGGVNAWSYSINGTTNGHLVPAIATLRVSSLGTTCNTSSVTWESYYFAKSTLSEFNSYGGTYLVITFKRPEIICN